MTLPDAPQPLLALLDAEIDRAHAASEHEYERGLRFAWNPLLAAATGDTAMAAALAPLGVERLATAVHWTHSLDDPNDRLFCPACLDDAQRYAAAYARLPEAPR